MQYSRRTFKTMITNQWLTPCHAIPYQMLHSTPIKFLSWVEKKKKNIPSPNATTQSMFCFIENLTHHLFYWLKKFDLIEPPSQTPLTPVIISFHLHLLLQKKDQESNKRKQEINVCIVYWDFGENYEHDESLRWSVLCFLLVWSICGHSDSLWFFNTVHPTPKSWT